MAISEQQREARKKYIGSSDIASILGLNPWTTAEDVRLAKCGKLEEWQGNEATRAGEYLESAILQWAEDELHTSLQLDTMFIHHNGIMAANVDGTDYEDGEGFVVEAKTSGIVGKPYGDWGTPGTDEVPPMYYVQVQHQLACCGPEYKRGYVAALIGGYGFRMYTLDRDEETIKLIETAAAKFWNEYVLKDRPAPGGLATLEVLRRVRRETGLVVDIDPGGWRDFLAKREAAAAADKALDEAKRRLLSDIGAGDAARVGGEVVCTYAANKKGTRSIKVKDTQTAEAA